MIQSMTSPSPKNLILITNHFPYGTGEAFLENEIPYLIRSFDKVVILTRNVNASTRPVTEVNFSLERIDPDRKFVDIVIMAGVRLFPFHEIIIFLSIEMITLH